MAATRSTRHHGLTFCRLKRVLKDFTPIWHAVIISNGSLETEYLAVKPCVTPQEGGCMVFLVLSPTLRTDAYKGVRMRTGVVSTVYSPLQSFNKFKPIVSAIGEQYLTSFTERVCGKTNPGMQHYVWRIILTLQKLGPRCHSMDMAAVNNDHVELD